MAEDMKKKKPVEMVCFRDQKGNVVFAVPSSMTIGEWVRLGLPKPQIVARNTPWKPNEVRAP